MGRSWDNTLGRLFTMQRREMAFWDGHEDWIQKREGRRIIDGPATLLLPWYTFPLGGMGDAWARVSQARDRYGSRASSWLARWMGGVPKGPRPLSLDGLSPRHKAWLLLVYIRSGGRKMGNVEIEAV